MIVLDKISFPNGEVRFEYVFDRIDCVKEPRLKTIVIKEAGSDQFKWDFEYNYFTSNVFHNEKPTLTELRAAIPMFTSYYTDSWNRNRLKLTLIKKTSITESISETYKFGYNETWVPTKLAMSNDHWGYYNGKSNSSLIPQFIQNVSDDPNILKIEYGGIGDSDREASEEHCQAFALKEIIYPTGGKTIFTYESNKYKTDDFENDPYKRDFMYSNNEVYLDFHPGLRNAGPTWNQSKPFNLTGNSGTSLPVTIKIKIWIDKSIDRFQKELNIGIFGTNGYPYWYFSYNGDQVPTGSTGTYYYEKYAYISLAPGNYTLKASGYLISCIELFEIGASSFSSPVEYLNINPFSLGGGLRVKKIQSNKDNVQQVSGKRFVYTNDGSNSEIQTSGRLMFYPRYRNSWKSCSSNGLRGNGYSVGYSKVHVIDIDNNGNDIGKVVYEYENKPDLNLFYTWEEQAVLDPNSRPRVRDENPLGIGGFKHSENGLLRKESIYKNYFSTPIKETIFEYLGLGGGPYIVWGVLKSDLIDYGEGPVVCFQDCSNECLTLLESQPKSDRARGYLYPAIRPMKQKLSKKREIFYENGQTMERVTDFQYNTKDYIKKETLSSNNKVLKSIEYKYPNDLQGNSIMNTLVEKNRISEPVEIKQIINESSQYQVNNYILFNNIPRIFNVKTDTGLNKTLETRVNYLNYDSYGNPTVISYEGGPGVVYFWGYHGQYPVAKIETLSTSGSMLYPIICDLIGSANLPLLENPTDTQLLSIFSNLKNNSSPYLQGALITIYTYKPLVGMTSKTDPNGITTYYEYDDFGRLKQGKDGNGKIIDQYDYHYKP